ncbi:unnamed protein product [Paramecium sonneborni]|uniref:Uncharacterized protein n=1 Tax=Paramecium sonneborni TaxID=65129 RepID=A0A8S1RIU6_9CILI|nr:unnamed protein product [Paramecium sonneborni]CAD8127212.1 unnamed protein product [Paramecium sonneborni]
MKMIFTFQDSLNQLLSNQKYKRFYSKIIYSFLISAVQSNTIKMYQNVRILKFSKYWNFKN